MAYDSDIDALMTRTATRPIPMGHIAREDALAFGWTLSVASVAIMWLFVNCPGGGAAGLHDLLLCRRLYALAEAPHAAEHRDRRLVRRAAAGHRLGRGDRHRCRWRRWCWSRSSSCGRRRISGRCRCGAPTTTPAPACRCCRWCRASASPAARSCSTRWCWRRWAWCPPSSAWAACSIWRRRPRIGFWFLLGSLRHLRERDEAKEPAAKRLFGVSLLYLFAPVRRPDRRAPARIFAAALGMRRWMTMSDRQQCRPRAPQAQHRAGARARRVA